MLNGIEVGALRGAEIGPLNRPVVKRHESEIYYVDHCSTEDLIRKYTGHNDIATEGIVQVDFIWGEESLVDILGNKAPLDYIIACHVIEHVPDLCGWLKETADALKVGGRLLLAVPDKRFTFDLYRRPSSFDEVLAAWKERRRRPGLRGIMDHFANVVSANTWTLWDEPTVDEHVPYVHGPEYLELAQREFLEGKYVDVHCWVFTPWHFMNLMGLMVKEMSLPFDLKHFLTTQHHELEFFVQLEKVNNPSTKWEEAAHRARREAEQLNQVGSAK